MDREMLRIFGGDGPFTDVPGYTPRREQIQLASQINQIIKNGGTLIAEAGTGTGKSYAALVPAMLSDERVVVATASIALQEQYLRDIPKLKTILNKEECKVALLKGRVNYLCKDLTSNQRVRSRLSTNQIKAIEVLWETGDRSNLPISISDMEWSDISAVDDDDCSGKSCPHYDECYYYNQRSKALEADIVIVNYHVLFVDRFFMPKELLGEFEVLIADEAHRVPEIVRDFFEETVSPRTVERILFQTRKLGGRYRSDAIKDILENFTKQQQKLLKIETNTPLPAEQFEVFEETLRITEKIHTSVGDELEGLEGKDRKILQTIRTKLGHLAKLLKLLINQEDTCYIRWITPDQARTMKMRMLDVSEPLSALFDQIPCSVLMSATLQTSSGFDFIKRETGLTRAKTLALPNIFDFTKQVKFHAVEPEEMPDPSDPSLRKEYISATIEKISEVVSVVGGRTMALFTSIEALQQAKNTLTARFPKLNIYTQGDLASRRLAEKFALDERGILLGTRTFFEGIDIPGAALSCVILDRFPFQSAGDPLVQARQQKDPKGFYFKWYLPAALIVFKQGFGRLIRAKSDKGVFVILDPRVKHKYHKSICQTIQSELEITGWSDIKGELTNIRNITQ